MKLLFLLLCLFNADAIAKENLNNASPKCTLEKTHLAWDESAVSNGKVYLKGIVACVDGKAYPILSYLSQFSRRTHFANGLCHAMGFTYFVGAQNRELAASEKLAKFSLKGAFDSLNEYTPIINEGEYLVGALDMLVCKGL